MEARNRLIVDLLRYPHADDQRERAHLPPRSQGHDLANAPGLARRTASLIPIHPPESLTSRSGRLKHRVLVHHLINDGAPAAQHQSNQAVNWSKLRRRNHRHLATEKNVIKAGEIVGNVGGKMTIEDLIKFIDDSGSTGSKTGKRKKNKQGQKPTDEEKQVLHVEEACTLISNEREPDPKDDKKVASGEAATTASKAAVNDSSFRTDFYSVAPLAWYNSDTDEFPLPAIDEGEFKVMERSKKRLRKPVEKNSPVTSKAAPVEPSSPYPMSRVNANDGSTATKQPRGRNENFKGEVDDRFFVEEKLNKHRGLVFRGGRGGFRGRKLPRRFSESSPFVHNDDRERSRSLAHGAERCNDEPRPNASNRAVESKHVNRDFSLRDDEFPPLMSITEENETAEPEKKQKDPVQSPKNKTFLEPKKQPRSSLDSVKTAQVSKVSGPTSETGNDDLGKTSDRPLKKAERVDSAYFSTGDRDSKGRSGKEGSHGGRALSKKHQEDGKSARGEGYERSVDEKAVTNGSPVVFGDWADAEPELVETVVEKNNAAVEIDVKAAKKLVKNKNR